jgi:hypothetical protein
MAAGLSARLCGIQGLARFDINRSSTVRQGPETTPLCCDFAWSRNALCQAEMTETTSYQFTHLAPAEAGLGRIFARPKAIAAGCVIVIAGLGWLYLALLISAPAGSWFAMMQALCRALPDGAWNVPAAAVTASMWGAMTLAMMLPSASPMILTYAEIAETAARKGEHVAHLFTPCDRDPDCSHARRIARHRHYFGGCASDRSDFHRRRHLSILGAQTRLSHALPESIPVLFHKLGHDAPRRIPPRNEAGAVLSWLLLGDDAGDAGGRDHECRLDGRAGRGHDN